MCHKNVLDIVVHTKVTKDAIALYKARMIFALDRLILKSDNIAECVVTIDANKIVVDEVLL